MALLSAFNVEEKQLVKREIKIFYRVCSSMHEAETVCNNYAAYSSEFVELMIIPFVKLRLGPYDGQHILDEIIATNDNVNYLSKKYRRDIATNYLWLLVCYNRLNDIYIDSNNPSGVIIICGQLGFNGKYDDIMYGVLQKST